MGYPLRRAVVAATAYFLVLFGLGFLFGTIRVIFVAPRTGPLIATALEAPLMLAAAVFVCGWLVRRWRVSPLAGARWAMVAVFLALLFVFETVLGAMLFGQTAAQLWATLATTAGLLGLSTQVVAALLPLVLGRAPAR